MSSTPSHNTSNNQPPSSTTEPSGTSKDGKPLPALSLKWGRSPTSPDSKNTEDKPDFSTYYTPEEQEKLRAKGVNPTLKAEMEWSKSKSEGKGIWGKVAQTAMGGGWIK